MWISSAVSETTRRRTWSPLWNDSGWMPPCGWPFTTLTVFGAGWAAVDGAPAAEVPVLEAPDGPVEPPSSPPGRTRTNARMRTTMVTARMPMRCGVVTMSLLATGCPAGGRLTHGPRHAAPRGAPRRAGPGRSLLHRCSRHEVRANPRPPRRLPARRGRDARCVLAREAARRDFAAAPRPRARAAGGGPRRAASLRCARGARLPRTPGDRPAPRGHRRGEPRPRAPGRGRRAGRRRPCARVRRRPDRDVRAWPLEPANAPHRLDRRADPARGQRSRAPAHRAPGGPAGLRPPPPAGADR